MSTRHETWRFPTGEVALFDRKDAKRIRRHSWHLQLRHDGKAIAAASFRRKGKQIRLSMHHLITGALLPGMQVDHINGNPLDNRRCNLRVVDQRNNMANWHSIFSNTGYRGVHRRKRGKKFRARVRLANGDTMQRWFNTAKEAAQWWDEQATKVWGACAATNARHRLASDNGHAADALDGRDGRSAPEPQE